MINLYQKGSEWNKWDMHIHTPASILNNGFGDDWDEYVQKLFKKAIQEQIVAIGITDYFSIEGYKKLREEYLNSELKLQDLFTEDEIIQIKNIFIFPNIEFRINKLVIGRERDLKWNKKVNFHVLFSDMVATEDIEENFIQQLKFENIGVGDDTPQKVSLNKRNLIELGNRLIQEQPEFSSYSPLYVGILNASIDDNEIVKLLSSQKSKFKGKYLLALPTDEDLSQVSWSSQGHLARKVLFQKSHIVFSSNKSTIEFSLGQKHPSNEDFVNEFGNPKPCLWGSDAHDFDTLFNPDKNRNTWIKSIPCFEGLKQVVYEPFDRVKIQLNIPEEKTPYLVIDKVRFIDKTSRKIYQPNWIELNQNLNTIIGGKSSGKSLLLYHIAKTISPEQVSNKTKLIQGSNYDIFKNKNPFDFEVLWKNGDLNKLSSIDDRNTQITFIPQLYINHLAEENGEQQLVKLIESILLQNELYQNFIESKKIEIEEFKSKIIQAIDERLRLSRDYKSQIEKRNSIGKDDKVKEEIDRLIKLIDNLKKESGFTESQDKEFKILAAKIESIKNSILNYESLKATVDNYLSFINSAFEDFKINSNKKLEDYNANRLAYKIIQRIHTEIALDITNNKTSFDEKTLSLNIQIDVKLEQRKRELTELEKKINPFKQKIKNQELLKRLEKELEIQKEKQNNIAKLNGEIQVIIRKGQDAKNEIFENYSNLFTCYRKINEELQKPEYNQIDKEITLESNLVFDSNRFEAFTNLFDNRARLNSYFIRIFDDNNIFIYDENTHVEVIKQIFEKLKTGDNEELRLKSNINIEDLFYKLLDDYFKISYKIIYKHDNFLQMSPGKRGLVLLQLILHISNASHPILIDQPEDNLDNRTIYDDLKQFIKEKKKDRQIIIVSHNANLVVSTDSENIVVCNQSGQQIGKDKKEFVFEYVNGALENTFEDKMQDGILFKYGIREHVCDILEGGKEAFIQREKKYGFL